MARGWIQGYPKKLGDVWMTRSFELDCKASPGVRAGARFGATCSARGRQLARATLTLDHESESGSLHTDPPLVNVRHFPRLAAGRHEDPQVHELVRARSRDRSVSTVWEGAATLELSPAPGEQHTAADAAWTSCVATASRSPTRSMTLRPSRSTADDRHRRGQLRDGRRLRGRHRSLDRRGAGGERRALRRDHPNRRLGDRARFRRRPRRGRPGGARRARSLSRVGGARRRPAAASC